MFKSLLQTIPTLSGNISLCCELDNYNYNKNNDEYDIYVKYANMMPLQNEIIKEPIIVNLLEGSWEYDVAKFYTIYESSFFEPNYNITKDDYEKVDLFENNEIHQRDKNNEFGCKRLNYHAQKYQFMFYAPFYIDNIEHIPDCFKIKLEFDNNTSKILNIHIGDITGKRNYLYEYLKRYVNKIDDNVIYLLPDMNQCSCEGINVRFGGFSLIKDNKIGMLYNDQMTINLFDYIVTETFKRNKLTMRQIFPLAFVFNINDLFSNNEKRLLKYHKVNISGNYYKDGIKLPFYSFENNYTNYTLSSDVYELSLEDNEYSKINKEYSELTSKNYPSLQEANFYKYKYTNKLNTLYCPWKLKYSSDDNPYIFNMTFAFKNKIENNTILNSNIYGEFPIFTDSIKPSIINNPNDPTDIVLSYSTLHDYNANDNYLADEQLELEKYYALRNNHLCDWLTPYNEKTFLKDENWSIMNKNKCYHKGVLYNLSYFDNELDRFGVFVNFDMSYYNIENLSKIKLSEFAIKNSYDSANLYIRNDNKQTIDLDSYNNIKVMFDNEHILLNVGVIKDVAYWETVYDSGANELISYSLSYYDEELYPDLNSFLSTYYVDYTEEFFNTNKFVIDESEDISTSYFAYLYVPISYSNISQELLNELDEIQDDLSLYISPNTVNKYEELTSSSISYLDNDNTKGLKYSLFKRVPIKEYDGSTDGFIYSYVPIYNNGDNIYSGGIITNDIYTKIKFDNDNENLKFTDYYINDNYLYVDEYDMAKFIEIYNSKYPKNKLIYNFDTVNKRITFARFINKDHLKKFPKFISRDKDDNIIYQGAEIYNYIFVRKRYVDKNFNLFDEYIPLTKSHNIHNDLQYSAFLDKLSEQKTGDKIYFEYNDDGTVTYLDLFFYKTFYKISEQLWKAITTKNIPIQVYVQNYEDVLKEEFIYYDNLIDKPTKTYHPSQYFVPMLSDIFINNVTRNDITNINLSGNISYKDGFVIFDKYQYKCIMALDLYNDLNLFIDDPLHLNLPIYINTEMTSLSNVNDNILNTIKSFSDDNNVETNIVHYTDLNEDTIYTFTHDGLKYGFYLINIDCTNTKFSFRFKDTSCMLFNKIDGNIIDENKNKLLIQLIPYINENVFSLFLNKIQTIVYPNSFSLSAKYSPTVFLTKDSDDFYKYKDIIYKDIVYDIKFIENSKAKINLNRYTDYITPLIKKVNRIIKNRYAKIFKLNDNKFDENNIRRFDLNIYDHDKLLIGKTYDKNIHEANIEEFNQIEYKHFNDNLLYNLEESFEVTIDRLLTYDEVLEHETFEYTFKIFKERLFKYNKVLNSSEDENTNLFLYKRYNISYVSTPRQLNVIGTAKLYELTYKFTLI